MQLTKPLEYAKDALNPLLKQTIRRIISIDSQYRNQQTNSPSTKFTFDLSEPLKDVVSLKLYSVQIPYTWYTVNSDFGGNFFYLKGNVPGINNGLHDYKIAIPSGNYTPSGITNAVNVAIEKLTTTYTDISFGNTKVIYNNGVNDPNSGTGKCTIQIDVTKIYNQGNYSMKFPKWSTPRNDTLRLNTIPGYLGFNNQEYYCSSIYSSFFSKSFNQITYSIRTTLSSFKVVPYVGNSYLTADVSYTPIIVSLPLTDVTETTIPQIVNLLNTALITNTKFDNAFTSCTLVDVSSTLQYDSSLSYVKFNCKLDNYSAPIVQNLKLAAVFPYDPSYSLFYGSVSFFAFSSAITDASNNVICEFNELLSENPILQSSYDSLNASMIFQCIMSGYDNSYNNLIIPIPNRNYTLTSFIKSANTSIETSIVAHPRLSSLSGTARITFNSDPVTSFLNINTRIENTYYNSEYSIYATTGSCNLPQLLGLPSVPNTTQSNLVYNNASYQFQSVAFNASDVIYITPLSEGNKNAIPFIINLNTLNTYSNGSLLANYLNTRISEYRDPLTGLYPFSGSSVVYNGIFTLNLNIEVHINQSFYRLTLLSDPTPNIWTDLSFNPVYNIIDYSNNSFIINNKSPIKDNQITIFDGSNDTFYLSPSNSVDVFSSSGNNYLITIKINDTSINGSGTRYAINDLLNNINSQLANTIAKGTTITTFASSSIETYIKVRFNINKVFKTPDFKLVFYDPYSFASCFSNKSRNASTSIQNATWDTTLGWLLGYRNQIFYTLSDYTDTLNISGTDSGIYYLIDSTNVCVLIGDTNVSTNLYNYFLIILDDYVQNHLNDGLVTITNQQTSLSHGPFINVCDPVTGKTTSRPANYGNPGVTYTSQQLYAFNQQVQSQMVKTKSYSKGPFVKDIFGLLPVKTTGMAIGSVYVEFGGTLQNQQRLYFGPVNIHRMSIQLLNDRGNLVDLNNANWSFSFECEQLYKSGVS